jgi:hypothetical protein
MNRPQKKYTGFILIALTIYEIYPIMDMMPGAINTLIMGGNQRKRE